MTIDAIGVRHSSYDPFVTDQGPAVSNDESRRLSVSDDPGISALLLEGDISAQVAALAIRSGQEQRKANREIQVAEEAALQRAEQRQVDAMHEQADHIRMSGLIEGGFGVASGGLTIAGSLATNAKGEPDPVAKDYYRGAATLCEGGKALSSLYRADEADHKANATTHDHEAGHHRRNLDAARDAIREGQDLLERALDFYKASQQSAADAVSTAVRRA